MYLKKRLNNKCFICHGFFILQYGLEHISTTKTLSTEHFQEAMERNYALYIYTLVGFVCVSPMGDRGIDLWVAV